MHIRRKTKLFRILSRDFIIPLLIFFLFNAANNYTLGLRDQSSDSTNNKKVLSLKECIQIALENNHKIKASSEGINIADAQKKQAESGYWPQVSASGVYSLTNKDPMYILPGFKMAIPPISFAGYSISMNDINVPEEDIKLMDKQNFHASVDVTYPIYTGGKVQAINKEAMNGIEIARQDYKKSTLEVEYDVKRFYYATLMATQIYKIGKDALDRLNVTLELTESLYKNGSGKTTKLDYLKNKVMVDEARALVGGLENNIKSAKQALKFTLGIDKDFNLPDENIPFDSTAWDEGNLLVQAYNNNPDWIKLNSAVSLYKAKIDNAKSDFLPSVAIMGSFNQNFNSYKYGISNNINSTLWMIGLGVEIPVFNGFRTKNQVNEAEAQLKNIKQQKDLMHDALILQIKEALNNSETSVASVRNTYGAMQSASESRSLTERAFQQDMADAKDLLESQITESLMEVQYQKALYDHAMAEAKLELIIGSVLNNN